MLSTGGAPTMCKTWDVTWMFRWVYYSSTMDPLFFSEMKIWTYMGGSWNRGTPRSSIFVGFSIRNLPFWDTLIYGNPRLVQFQVSIEPFFLNDSQKLHGDVRCISPMTWLNRSHGFARLRPQEAPPQAVQPAAQKAGPGRSQWLQKGYESG